MSPEQDGPIAKRLTAWQQRRADERLFGRLADAHDLDGGERDLLLALADRHRLVRSSEVFVRPSLFVESPDLARWDAKAIRALQAKLAPQSTPPPHSVS